MPRPNGTDRPTNCRTEQDERADWIDDPIPRVILAGND
jgi:hypothetical protein